MLRRANRQKEQPAEPRKSEPFTYIHQATIVTGTLKAQGRVRVHGTILGDIDVDGTLEVAESGRIEGQLVQADEVKILGFIKANVEVRGKVEIWSKGQLEGDVRASALDIEEGATFIGRSEMRPAGSPLGTLPATTLLVSEVVNQDE